MRGLLRARAILEAAWVVALGVSCSCGGHRYPLRLEPNQEASVPAADAEWVEVTLRSLSLREQVGQMLFLRAFGLPRHPEDPELLELRRQVRELGVGGLVLFRSELDSVPWLLELLEAEARLPLLVAGDFEAGVRFRVEEGVTPLPTAMAIGATGRPEAAYWVGQLTAREALALGAPWVLAPVADINREPRNPVIHLRSFGDDPVAVSQMVAAFVRGVQEAGGLATAKHFPGHGGTEVDSHVSLPVVPGDRSELEARDLVPFRAAVQAGVGAILVGHLAVPGLDPTGAPASVSPAIIHGLLRRELGFSGLVATDALEMKGLGQLWMGRAAVLAAAAGADVLMLPGDPQVVGAALLEAVSRGELKREQIEQAVRRILSVKQKLGQLRPWAERRQELSRRRLTVGHPADREAARRLFEESITVIRDRSGLLPLPLEAPPPLAVLQLEGPATATFGAVDRWVEALERFGVEVARLEVPKEIPEDRFRELWLQARSAKVRVVPLAPRVVSTPARPALAPDQRAFLETLERDGAPLVTVALTHPYVLQEVPFASTLLASYGTSSEAIQAAVGAIFGRFPWKGRLPVALEGLAARGEGLERPARLLRCEVAPPELVGFPSEGLREVDKLLAQAIAERAFPGAVVAVGRRGKLVHLRAYGKFRYDPDAPPVQVDTLYDLASLTKVVATTTAAMILHDEGRLDLDRPVADYLPCFQGGGREKVTVRHLLTHSSGLEAWAPLYETLRDPAELRDRLCELPLVDPPGVVSRYSDLGFLLLGEVLKVASGRPLQDFVRDRVFRPLGFRWTDWNPPASLKPRIAPTEWDRAWRHRLIHGEVHDENAAALGGIAAHAGLFGTAEELARFAQMLLWKGVYEGRRWIRASTVELFTRRDNTVPASTRALGWDTKSEAGSSAGTRFSSTSFGHTGFTGTSLWIDPERELFLILLTNRVHPSRENRKIQSVRAALADAVVEALERGKAAAPDPPRVLTGLERVERGEDWGLRGKRLGLLSHPAAVTREGKSALEVLQEQGLQVVRLFAAEHGFDGQAGAGEVIPDGREVRTGLPVVSLYGRDWDRSPDPFSGLDAVVVDLQDVGARFYTYAATVLELLERSAKQGFEVVVFDRPNPLGGLRVRGPERDSPQRVPLSLVNLLPGPLLHGMTLGELLRYASALRAPEARLTVVPMEGWRRHFLWPELGRTWVPPSPNLKSFEAALVYPGMAWLEATNVSEGRGTEAPFLTFGAPWLDPSQLSLSHPGLRFHRTEFTPRAMPGAPSPKFLGQRCRGFRIEVMDPSQVDPYRLGVDLLRALSRQPGFEWLEEGRALDRLLGVHDAVKRLVKGPAPEEHSGSRASFLRAREPFLLYPP